MGFIFALLLMGLPLAAAYVDMMQAQGATKLWGFDLPKTGGYTPRWDGTSATSPVTSTSTSPSAAKPVSAPPQPVTTPSEEAWATPKTTPSSEPTVAPAQPPEGQHPAG